MKNNILHSLMASAILERLITRLDCNDAEHKKTTAIIRGILPAYRDRVQRSLDAQSSFEMPLLKEFVQSPNLRMCLAGSGGPAKAGSKANVCSIFHFMYQSHSSSTRLCSEVECSRCVALCDHWSSRYRQQALYVW